MLLLTLGLFAVLWFVVLGFANSSVQSLRQAQHRVSAERAQWTAEAGLKLALQALAKDATYSPKDAWVAMANNKDDAYKVEIFSEKKSPVLIPTGCVYVLSTGKAAQGMEHKVAAVVKLGGAKKSLLNFSVFANSLSLSGGCKIDSFDSTIGPQVKTSLANVATNSIVAGAISLSGGSWVQGTIQVGVGGKTGPAKPSTPTSKTTNVVWKDWNCWSLAESAMTSPLEFPPVAAPAAGTTNVRVDWRGNDLKPGSYRDLQASGGGEVRLSGGTYVFRSLKLTGGARLSFIGTEPVTVYVITDLDLTGGTLYNTSQQPKNMTFMLAKDAQAKMNGGAQAYAVVYGPEADFTLSGGTDLYGAIVGRTVDLKGGASIHYDTDLAKTPPQVLASGGSSAGGTTVVSWQRL
jgi:hypothetical protein